MQVLTFDIEDWFHLLDLESVGAPPDWEGRPSRIHEGVDRILDLLAKHGRRASFFVLGWVAERYPEVVRRIDSTGCEIGTHSHHHQLIYEMTPEAFEEDLNRSIGHLEDVTGKRVRLFRAPGFSITDDCLWALEVIAKRGIEVDCSLFSAPRNHGGVRRLVVRHPSILSTEYGELKEFPLSTQDVLGRPVIYSGGGFFRLLPYSLVRRMTENAPYTMTYFHPRDFDAAQPRLKMPPRRRFQSYVGIKGALNKLDAYLRDFNFTDIAECDAEYDWASAARIRI